MKKNIIISGVPRSGKSTLAKRLCISLHMSWLPADSLVSTFGKVFPDLGITHYGEDHEVACRAFFPFFCELLGHLEYEGMSFVSDVYHLLPEDVALYGLAQRYSVLFLGYPSADVPDKCARIRADARPFDWTAKLTDQELEAQVGNFVGQSASIRKSCEELGMRFLDTGQRFAERLDEAVRELSA